MRHAIGAMLTLALWFADRSVGHAEVVGPLRLADVVEEARQRNPQILAAREQAKAAAAVPARVSAYDDPTFSYEAFNAPESFDLTRAENNIFRLSQKVPFPGKRRLAGTVAERDAERVGRELEAIQLEVIVAVKRAYYDLWRVHQSLRVYSRDKGLVQRFALIAENKYAVGEVSQTDVLRAQVELTRLVNRVTTATLAIDSARAELNALLSRPAEEPLGVPEAPPAPQLRHSLKSLTTIALQRRPELAAEAAAIAREEASLQLAKRNYFPDFEFAASRFQNFGQRDGFGVMASISIPLAYRHKYDAGVAEAGARLASARAELRRLQDRVRREVTQAFVTARSALLRRELFVTTHIPQAEQVLRVTERSYETGIVDFLRLIDSIRESEAIHLEHYEAAAEFEKAYADLERAVGGMAALDASD